MVLLLRTSFAQSYDQFMDLAELQIKSEKYNEALLTFQRAFKKKDSIGKYDYANAAVVAIHCGKDNLAIEWIKEGAELGLGNNEQELYYFRTDSIFKTLLSDYNYKQILENMEAQIQAKIYQEKLWRLELKNNRIPVKGEFYQKAPEGFASYTIDHEGLQIPYLVYVPKSYSNRLPIRTLFFLHGGKEDLPLEDLQTRSEPIFTIGDSTNSIVVYPLQKGNAGWLNYEHTSVVLSKILDEVKLHYFIDKNKIYLGGMSTGGNISYKFAQEKKTPFRAFYMISARPYITDFQSKGDTLAIINPIYSLHAKDDSLYSYKDLINVHRKAGNFSQNNWKLEFVEKGGHGFLYIPNTLKSTLEFFKIIFIQEEK
ncbi:MAG: uncharacterized protein K0R59_2005 [Sphingobacterium sp.]|nr:uncharacterized protein [Sphingobacterium sp.]